MAQRKRLSADSIDKLIDHLFPDPAELPKQERVKILLRGLLDTIDDIHYRAFLTILRRGAAAELARKESCSPELIRRKMEEAAHQLRLCLSASWLENFRLRIARGQTIPLPKYTFSNFNEILEGRKLGSEEQQKILALKERGKTVKIIKKQTGATRLAINFVLKTAGKMERTHEGMLSDADYMRAYIETSGNATGASTLLRCDPNTIKNHWIRLGLPMRKAGRPKKIE